MNLGSLAYNTVKSRIPQEVWNNVKSASKLNAVLIRTQQRVNFLQQCLSRKVIPTFLSVHLPSHLQQHRRLFQKSQRKALQRSLAKAKKDEISTYRRYEDFCTTFSTVTWDVIQAIVKHQNRNLLSEISQRHKKKLDHLSKKQHPSTTATSSNPTNNVHNISGYELSELEQEALSYGFSMCWPG